MNLDLEKWLLCLSNKGESLEEIGLDYKRISICVISFKCSLPGPSSAPQSNPQGISSPPLQCAHPSVMMTPFPRHSLVFLQGLPARQWNGSDSYTQQYQLTHNWIICGSAAHFRAMGLPNSTAVHSHGSWKTKVYLQQIKGTIKARLRHPPVIAWVPFSPLWLFLWEAAVPVAGAHVGQGVIYQQLLSKPEIDNDKKSRAVRAQASQAYLSTLWAHNKWQWVSCNPHLHCRVETSLNLCIKAERLWEGQQLKWILAGFLIFAWEQRDGFYPKQNNGKSS